MKLPGNVISKLNMRVQESIARRRDAILNRHIVIFESDDWGAIRVPSKAAHSALTARGYKLDDRPYERFDGLESDRDVEALADVLLRYVDKTGNHPAFTLNYLSANPDFEAIRRNDFSRYQWESIKETYNRYDNGNRVVDIVKSGIDNGVFETQFHGREHFDIKRWMSDLRRGDKDVLTAFDFGMCGLFPKENPSAGNRYVIAFNSLKTGDRILDEGVDEFSKIWGRRPESIVAPCYTWREELNADLIRLGFSLIQSARWQKIPESSKRIAHFTGQKSVTGLTYTVRNCAFEPSTSEASDVTDMTMEQIRLAFKQGKPAIISTHRINYTSRISEENRNRSLRLLDQLIERIIKEWSDVEFVTGNNLIKMI